MLIGIFSVMKISSRTKMALGLLPIISLASIVLGVMSFVQVYRLLKRRCVSLNVEGKIVFMKLFIFVLIVQNNVVNAMTGQGGLLSRASQSP